MPFVDNDLYLLRHERVNFIITNTQMVLNARKWLLRLIWATKARIRLRACAQSDQGFCCTFAESIDSVECTDKYRGLDQNAQVRVLFWAFAARI